MDKKLAMKWVAALRSGKYQQGRTYLRTEDNKYCCLGVLCELQGIKSRIKTMNDITRGVHGVHAYESQRASLGGDSCEVSGYPGLDLRTPLGFFNRHSDCLAKLNDQGTSFSELADIIEQNYEEL